MGPDQNRLVKDRYNRMTDYELEIKKAMETPYLVDRRLGFYASSLPYCPRKHFIHFKLIEQGQNSKLWDFNSQFYTSGGNFIHQAVQDQLGIGGLMYGNWKCCGITHHDLFGPVWCPICGRNCSYVEYKLDIEPRSRCDGVLPTMNSVLEIKTKGSSAIKGMNEPVWYHWAYQASVYANGLSKKLNMNLDNTIIMYVSRENPRTFKIFSQKAVKTAISASQEMYEIAKSKFKLNVLPDRICESKNDGDELYCDYSPICFSPDIENMIL